MTRAPALLADLLETVEAATPWGGRSTTYLPLGPVWLTPVRLSERQRVIDGRDQVTARRLVEARADGRLIAGRVLRFGGGDWRIRTVEPSSSGRVRIDLEAAR